LLLCTVPFAKKHGINLRRFHARFNFDLQNRAFFIAGNSRSQHAELTVNGDAVTRQMFVLNHHSMKVRFDKLGYVFKYTGYAETELFKEARQDYLTTALKGPHLVNFEMPTPLAGTRTIGLEVQGVAARPDHSELLQLGDPVVISVGLGQAIASISATVFESSLHFTLKLTHIGVELWQGRDVHVADGGRVINLDILASAHGAVECVAQCQPGKSIHRRQRAEDTVERRRVHGTSARVVMLDEPPAGKGIRRGGEKKGGRKGGRD
jgi:hypothetical protein